MVTDRQIAANRRTALKPTGPRTPRAKPRRRAMPPLPVCSRIRHARLQKHAAHKIREIEPDSVPDSIAPAYSPENCENEPNCPETRPGPSLAAPCDSSPSCPFFLHLAYTIPHANNEMGRDTGDGREVPSYGAYDHAHGRRHRPPVRATEAHGQGPQHGGDFFRATMARTRKAATVQESSIPGCGRCARSASHSARSCRDTSGGNSRSSEPEYESSPWGGSHPDP